MERLRKRNLEGEPKHNSMKLGFEELRPEADWSQNPASHFLSLDLPGFKKEDIKVKIDRFGKLTVEGKRMTPNDCKYYHFDQVFHVPEDVNIDQISGKLDEGRLKLTMPKKGIEETTTKPPIPPPNKEEFCTMPDKSELLPESITGVGEEEAMMERFIANVQKHRRIITVAAVAFIVGFYVSKNLR